MVQVWSIKCVSHTPSSTSISNFLERAPYPQIIFPIFKNSRFFKFNTFLSFPLLHGIQWEYRLQNTTTPSADHTQNFSPPSKIFIWTPPKFSSQWSSLSNMLWHWAKQGKIWNFDWGILVNHSQYWVPLSLSQSMLFWGHLADLSQNDLKPKVAAHHVHRGHQ